MDEEEAAKLAEECGGENINGELFYMTKTQLAWFADSVLLDEREACAKVCEKWMATHGDYFAEQIRM
jgi:hypothetical protein